MYIWKNNAENNAKTKSDKWNTESLRFFGEVASTFPGNFVQKSCRSIVGQRCPPFVAAVVFSVYLNHRCDHNRVGITASRLNCYTHQLNHLTSVCAVYWRSLAVPILLAEPEIKVWFAVFTLQPSDRIVRAFLIDVLLYVNKTSVHGRLAVLTNNPEKCPLLSADKYSLPLLSNMVSWLLWPQTAIIDPLDDSTIDKSCWVHVYNRDFIRISAGFRLPKYLEARTALRFITLKYDEAFHFIDNPDPLNGHR